MARYKLEEERLKNLGRKEGEIEGFKKVATIMKKDGKTMEEIMRYTALSKEQIEKL